MSADNDYPDFSEYDREASCPLCQKTAKPTVHGDHFKCSECSHVFNVDGSALNFDCWCKTCMPTPQDVACLEDMAGKSHKKSKGEEPNGERSAEEA